MESIVFLKKEKEMSGREGETPVQTNTRHTNLNTFLQVQSQRGIHKIGEIDGVKIFCDPLNVNNEVFVGRTNVSIQQQGLTFVPNDLFNRPLVETELSERIQRQPNRPSFIIGGTEDLNFYRQYLERYLSNNE